MGEAAYLLTYLLTYWAETWAKRRAGEIRGHGCGWMAQMAMWALWTLECGAAGVEEVAEKHDSYTARTWRTTWRSGVQKSDSDQRSTCPGPRPWPRPSASHDVHTAQNWAQPVVLASCWCRDSCAPPHPAPPRGSYRILTRRDQLLKIVKNEI